MAAFTDPLGNINKCSEIELYIHIFSSVSFQVGGAKENLLIRTLVILHNSPFLVECYN